MISTGKPEVNPATFVLAEDDGVVTVQVSVTYPMDGEAIVAKLYAAYSKPFENGTPLPEQLTMQDVMRTLAQESANCADGWHFWESEPGQAAWDAVHPWAEAQVRRLFPMLTWPEEQWSEYAEVGRMVEHLRQMGIPAEEISTGGGCWAARVALCQGHDLNLTIASGEDWCWQIYREGEQSMAGYWPGSDIPRAARRTKKLIKGLGNVVA
ncbi:hypothetical protein [Streptomyces sp. RTd22]|uniref:hypothetical protein n=1 Tax=Streptomyces sp. RTd22 TaxID=1841249 RepID=UPI0007C43A7E|nr:hypothetical protein [Streptomyces sp. RTd22]